MGNAAFYGSPSYDEKSARKKSDFWKKFIDSLTWEKLEERGNRKTMGDWLKALGGFAVVKENNKDKKDDS